MKKELRIDLPVDVEIEDTNPEWEQKIDNCIQKAADLGYDLYEYIGWNKDNQVISGLVGASDDKEAIKGFKSQGVAENGLIDAKRYRIQKGLSKALDKRFHD